MTSQGGASDGATSENRYAPSTTSLSAPINHKVKEIEDAYVSQPLGTLSLTESLPSRPAYGTKGKTDQIWVNYIQVELKPDQKLFKYNIIVEPKAEGRKLHRVIELLLAQPPLTQWRSFTDFKKTLVSRDNIPEQRINVLYFPEDQNQPGPQATAYHVRIVRTNVLFVQQLLDTIHNPCKAYPEKEAMFQVWNIMLHHQIESLRHIAVVRNGAFPLSGNLCDIHDLGGGVQAVRGFFSSIRPAAGRILINVNITWKAFYKPGLLHDLHFKNFTDFKNDRKKVMAFGRSLEGIPIQRLNSRGLPRPIYGLATMEDGRSLGVPVGSEPPVEVRHFAADSQNVRFWLKDRKHYITVRDYFENVLGIPLQLPYLPVVNVGSRGVPIYWPPELGVINPGQTVGHLLNAEQTTKMLQCAVRKPADNFALIESYGLRIIGLSAPSPFMDPNYVRIRPGLLNTEGRFLQPPTLRYTQSISIRSAAWNAKGHKFNFPGRMRTWTFMFIEVKGRRSAFSGPTAASEFKAAVKDFQNGLAIPGITAHGYIEGKRVQLNDEEDSQLESFLERATMANIDLLWVVIPSEMKELYDQIKYLGDVKLGLATVVSVDKKIAGKPGGQGRGQYFGNEALKVNLKLKGRNQVVVSRLHFVNDGDTMILGADVTHPSTDGRKTKLPSVAGVVMCDKYLARYHSTLSLQNRRQEMITRLGDMVVRMVQKWKAMYNTLPRNVLIYRDGVSEGQYDMVRDHEMRSIKNACGPIYASASVPQPRITIIIVTKRNHTRFAPMHNADDKANCRAGLVVDRGITDTSLWDFFFQPHSTLQGTARPGHYVVVHDEIFRPYSKAKNLNPADVCQDLTQSLCYTFGRATRAVGICTPAYYADILCDRANCYLRAAPDDTFDTDSDQASDSDGRAKFKQFSERDLERLQAIVQTHPKLEDTMFFI